MPTPAYRAAQRFAYLGSVAVRTLLRDRNVTLFEVTQTAIALVVGYGGAIFLA